MQHHTHFHFLFPCHQSFHCEKQVCFQVHKIIYCYNNCFVELDYSYDDFILENHSFWWSGLYVSILMTGRSEDLTCSPTCSIFTKIGQTPLYHQVQELKHSPDKKNLAKALEFSDSPVPPVLHTPGIKQIPSMKEFISESKVKQKINADVCVLIILQTTTFLKKYASNNLSFILPLS